MSLPGQRVLVLPLTRRDGEVTLALLAQSGLDGRVCATPAVLCEHMAQGVGVVLLTEAALCDPAIEQFVAALALQPPWSDVPVVVLARDRQPPAVVAQVLERLDNVTLLDRPVSTRSMLSAVRSALRARERQYQIRDHFLLQERAEAALREGDRRKDDFMATLAHELRNPLAPLRTGLSVLRGLPLPSPDPRFTHVLGMMERQMGLLVRLVDDLLDVARISRGKIELVRQPLELHEVVDAALEGCAPLIKAARHGVELHLTPQPIWVEADRARVVQVLGNLIGNAAKYTPDGGRITVELRLREGRAELSVSDTGVGIAPQMLTRVFDMYVQLQDGASRARGGLGLGLSLVRRLVEMHGGTVAAHSPGAGAGSTFVVALPLLPTPAPGAPAVRNNDPLPKPAPALRVLVIDDNTDAADALCMCLQTMGHAACARYSGGAGLQAAQALQPDVVFCDIGLPDIDGREVAARLRRDPAHRGVTLVALTGWGAEKDRQLSSNAGFDAHLTKPASIDDIGRVLGLRP